MGNTDPQDGYTYRGRGLLQLTGKAGYAEASAFLSREYPGAPNLVVDPDAVIEARWCLRVAAVIWLSKGCNPLADEDEIYKITRKMNGGQVGIGGRIEWAKRTKAIWC